MEQTSLNIEQWDTSHQRWAELMARTDIEDLDLEAKRGEWHLGIYTIVALYNEAIVGVLRFWTQEIGVDEDKPAFLISGKAAVEAKVVTFHVDQTYRRQGIGRALQFAAIRLARRLNCYQLRSRSAYNRTGNYALKASLGFGINPGRNTSDGPDNTAFFILPLQLAPELLEALQ